MDLNVWRKMMETQLRVALEGDEHEDVVNSLIMDQLQQNIEIDFEVLKGKHGGSREGRSTNKERNRVEGHNRTFRDYFAEDSLYGELLFRRRFRMRRELLLRIMNEVCQYDSFFLQKRDATGLLGLSSIQKCTAALRMLAYGVAGDYTDENCRIGESTAIESMKRFVKAIRVIFEPQYLRQPTKCDHERQMQINANRGFPGMFGSIDCMHWQWKNCPVAWQGQFQNKDKKRSIVLEAIAEKSLWIWHAFFGLPGGNNDINVLDRSPFVANMLRGDSHEVKFIVNGHEYPRYYLLADGIYPPWSCFVKTIQEPQDERKSHFAGAQEAARKDVERCFGVLQARFAIVQNPSRAWEIETIQDILMACVVMHNMIVEDELELDDLENLFENIDPMPVRRSLNYGQLVQGTLDLENRSVHHALRRDLIAHLWNVKGTSRTE